MPRAATIADCSEPVTRLPDSSGFVYTGGKGLKQLKLFDVKTKKTRTLVEDVGGPARRPRGGSPTRWGGRAASAPAQRSRGGPVGGRW